MKRLIFPALLFALTTSAGAQQLVPPPSAPRVQLAQPTAKASAAPPRAAPSNPYNQALDAYKAGHVDDAMAKLRAYLNTKPTDASARGFLGFLELRQGKDIDQATSDLQAAVKLDPTNVVNNSNLASALMEQRKFVEAIPLLRFVIKKTPQDVNAQARLGEALSQSGEYEKALPYYSGMVARPDCPAAILMNYGLTLARLEKFAPAAKAYDRVTKLDPSAVGAWTSAGICYSKIGRQEDAVRCLAEAIKLGPTDPYDVHFVYATALAMTGHGKEALKQFQFITVLKPDGFPGWYNLGLINEKLGNDQDAITAYQQALQLNPDNPQTLINLAALQVKTGQISDAINELAGASKENPTSAPLHTALGLAYLNNNQPDQAVAEFKTAVTLDPTDLLTRSRLAELYVSKKQWSDALAQYDALAKAAPNSDAVQAQRGEALDEMGRLADALDALTTAVDINPKNAIAWNNLGAVHEGLGSISAAKSDYKKAFEIDPKLIEAQKNLMRLNSLKSGKTAAPPPLAPAPKTTPPTAPPASNGKATP